MKTWILALLLAQGQAPPPLQPLPHPQLPEVFIPPPPTPLWIVIGAVSLLLAALVLVIWLLMRPRLPGPVAPKRPWQTAMRGLKELSSRVRTQPAGVTGGEISEILRQYFMDRYRIPAPFRTTREIFEEGAIPMTSSRLHRYAPLADLWDRLSFAPLPDSHDEAAELLVKAMNHLEEDRP